MLTIGLTGGIGSGKSTVSKLLVKLGAPIIDFKSSCASFVIDYRSRCGLIARVLDRVGGTH